MRHEADPPDDHGYLAPAVDWVRERGGCAACARSVLLKSLSSEPEKVKAALKAAGAPVGVYALLNVELHALRVGAQVDEGDAETDWRHR